MANDYENDQSLIDRQLLGRLGPDEAQQFQQRMQEPGFQDEFALQKEILEALENEENMALKTMLQQEEQAIRSANNRAGSPAKVVPMWIKWAAAAAVVLIVVAGWWLFGRSPSAAVVFANSFEIYPNTLVEVERGDTASGTDAQAAFFEYQNENYIQALMGFEALQAQTPSDDVAFYQANTLLRLGQTDNAIDILQKIITNGQTQYLDQSKWYLGLAWLKAGELENARIILSDLVAISSFKRKEAKEILEGLPSE